MLASQLNHWRSIMALIYSGDMYGAKIYAGPGNHEIRSSESEEVWQSIFQELPANGPSDETYMTYSFDYLNSHFVMLNTNRAGSAHTVNYEWLADDLAGTSADTSLSSGMSRLTRQGRMRILRLITIRINGTLSGSY